MVYLYPLWLLLRRENLMPQALSNVVDDIFLQFSAPQASTLVRDCTNTTLAVCNWLVDKGMLLSTGKGQILASNQRIADRVAHDFDFTTVSSARLLGLTSTATNRRRNWLQRQRLREGHRRLKVLRRFRKSGLPVKRHIPTSAHSVALWGHHTLPVAPQPLHKLRTTSFRTHCSIGKTCGAYLS
eukprot:281525-Amphidinium_carterae.2